MKAGDIVYDKEGLMYIYTGDEPMDIHINGEGIEKGYCSILFSILSSRYRNIITSHWYRKKTTKGGITAKYNKKPVLVYKVFITHPDKEGCWLLTEEERVWTKEGYVSRPF